MEEIKATREHKVDIRPFIGANKTAADHKVGIRPFNAKSDLGVLSLDGSAEIFLFALKGRLPTL